MTKNDPSKSLNKLGFWANLTVRGWNKGLCLIWSYLKEFLPPAKVQNGPNKVKNRPLTTIPIKMIENEKNSKLRVFFWLVSLPKDRYRRQAPYADVSETLGLRGAPKQPKMARNGQK